jgi:hypothetical protein
MEMPTLHWCVKLTVTSLYLLDPALLGSLPDRFHTGLLFCHGYKVMLYLLCSTQYTTCHTLLQFAQVTAAGCSLLPATRQRAACGCPWPSMLVPAPPLWAMLGLSAA